MNITLTPELEDQLLEVEAQLEWEAFQPEKDTIEWYDKYFIDYCDLGSPSTRPNYYRGVWAEINFWRKEREEFGDDDGWLSILRENWEQSEEDNAQFAKELAEELAAKAGITAGHAVPSLFSGTDR